MCNNIIELCRCTTRNICLLVVEMHFTGLFVLTHRQDQLLKQFERVQINKCCMLLLLLHCPTHASVFGFSTSNVHVFWNQFSMISYPCKVDF